MIVNSDALRLPFADAAVDAALCSPPYWGGLRLYPGAQDRDWPAIAYPPMPGLSPVEIPAQRVALGHEESPLAFVGHLLQVFREVRRVQRPGGCLAVNLGDCYNRLEPLVRPRCEPAPCNRPRLLRRPRPDLGSLPRDGAPVYRDGPGVQLLQAGAVEE